jgi:hypothetical protein
VLGPLDIRVEPNPEWARTTCLACGRQEPKCDQRVAVYDGAELLGTLCHRCFSEGEEAIAAAMRNRAQELQQASALLELVAARGVRLPPDAEDEEQVWRYAFPLTTSGWRRGWTAGFLAGTIPLCLVGLLVRRGVEWWVIAIALILCVVIIGWVTLSRLGIQAFETGGEEDTRR